MMSNQEQFAKAALRAIEEHVAAEIGTRPIAQWTDHDVTDTGILCRALADNGLPSKDCDAEKLDGVVSPLIFWQYHGKTVEEAMQASDVLDAFAALTVGGVTYALPTTVEQKKVNSKPQGRRRC